MIELLDNPSEQQEQEQHFEYTPEEMRLIMDGLAYAAKRQTELADAAKAETAELKEKSKRDVLIPTMLNKAASHEAIDKHVKEGKPFGVYMIDLNNFKKLNDEVDHATGDKVLIRLGELFNREADVVVGRMGGDEFVLLVDLSTGKDRTDIQTQMDNVYRRIKIVGEELITGDEPEVKAARKVGVGLSIGSSVFDPDHPLDSETLYAQAEQAMYEEKEGKGR